MIRTPFNTGWTAGPARALFDAFSGAAVEPRPVHLPHDLLRHETRDASGTSHVAYFPSATVEHVKRFTLPEGAGPRVVLEFDGVYRDAVVLVNGEHAGQRANGYSRFTVDVDPYLLPGENEVKVVARTHEDSRWYSGVGIHREVALLTGQLLHIGVDGLRITTPEVEDGRAVVAVATTVRNDGPTTRTATVRTRLLGPDGEVVAEDAAPVTTLPGAEAVLRQRLLVHDPALWDVDAPHLHRAEVVLLDGEDEVDREATAFGIRTLRLDPERGLRINGRTVKLRGACIHHDNGVLGSAAIRRAEERRVELLKAAGFNAIRSAHNPLSSAMLDACDRLGMLVMDETFDVWTVSKTAHDYSLRFADWWERDVDALVAQVFNHPSVVLYSIGNEIPETGTGIGSGWGRRLAERIRAQDPTRYITNGINPMVSVMRELGPQLAGGDLGVNELMSSMGDMMNRISESDLVSERTAESFAVLDVAGINYGDSRYRLDAERFPHRVIVGAETFPTHIAENWALVTELDHVIGDFTWTGWDYLGETGIGRTSYDPASPAMGAPYPWLTAWCGDIDITGFRRPVSYYRELVFGLTEQPSIAVLRPEHHGEPASATPWSWSDSIASWSHSVPAGSPITVEVCSAAPEVELLVNGRSVGRRPAGAANRFLARFETTWEPGEVVAIDRDGATELRRSTLRSADGDVVLTAVADRTSLHADDGDLAYVPIELLDGAGVLATHRGAEVVVTVTGAGVLEGLGSADPATTERFDGDRVRTFEGRALAVVRPSGAGTIDVTVSADGFAPVALRLTVDA